MGIIDGFFLAIGALLALVVLSIGAIILGLVLEFVKIVIENIFYFSRWVFDLFSRNKRY